MKNKLKKLLLHDEKGFPKFLKASNQKIHAKKTELTKLLVQASSPVATVVVAGSFSSGKSTFINSLLNRANMRDLCPMNVAPSTSSITTIKYGETFRIFKISEEHQKEEIAHDVYTKCVQHDSENEREVTQARYEFEITVPAEILKHISLVDTAGFNNSANEHDTPITVKKIKDADVILWITDIEKGVGATEKDWNSILECGIKDRKVEVPFYLVLNRADLKDPLGRKKIKEVAHRSIGGHCQEIIIYSALMVKDGIKTNFHEWDEDDMVFKRSHEQLIELFKEFGQYRGKSLDGKITECFEGYHQTVTYAFEQTWDQIEPFEPATTRALENLKRTVQRKLIADEDDLLEAFKDAFTEATVIAEEEFNKSKKHYFNTPYARIKVLRDDEFKFQEILAPYVEFIKRRISQIPVFSDRTIPNFTPDASELRKNAYKIQWKNNKAKEYYWDKQEAENAIQSFKDDLDCSKIYDSLKRDIEEFIDSLIEEAQQIDSELQKEHPSAQFENFLKKRKELYDEIQNHHKRDTPDVAPPPSHRAEPKADAAKSPPRTPEQESAAEKNRQKGENYEYGKNGFTKDSTKAKSCYQKAAQQGNQRAIDALTRLQDDAAHSPTHRAEPKAAAVKSQPKTAEKGVSSSILTYE